MVTCMKSSLLLLVLFFAFCPLSACDRPRLTGINFEEIDTSPDPEQTTVASDDPIVVTFKSGSLTITPRAKYKLSGMVISKEYYSDGWESTLSPVDLAIVWGKLAEPRYSKCISYSQSSRWYFFKTKTDSPIDLSYVSPIPATTTSFQPVIM